MDYLARLSRQLRWYAFAMFAVLSGLLMGSMWLVNDVLQAPVWLGYLVVLVIGLGITWVFSGLYTRASLEALRAIWQAVLHVAPQHQGTPAPDLQKLTIGQELVTNLIHQIYQLASTAAPGRGPTSQTSELALAITNNFPLPILAVNNQQNVIFANPAVSRYINQPPENIVGKNFYSLLDLSFPTEQTLDVWLNNNRIHAATAAAAWERVRLKLTDPPGVKQFDLAAYYNQGNSSGAETVITMFDKSATYSQDDQNLSFVALAVHELRTPLTILRGFMEVFDEELGSQVNDEMRGYMSKMKASAQQLTTFINNILNVVRIEENQLELHLAEENWTAVVQGVLADMNLRAQVQGKRLEFSAPNDMPPVAVDKISIYEVLANLIDNALKYSGNSQVIHLSSRLNQEGMIETSIADDGVGIPSSVLPHLFEKFQRNHRNRSQIGGTGLGLYLSKAIISAHGGNIWVRSKEGQGSVFSFTLKPYNQLAEELKTGHNAAGITRNAHGWIKNHSLYRR